MACVVGAAAQTKNDDVFIRIADDNMFSKCFVSCDKNGDNIVTYSEAAEATILSLSYGGRLNIIEDYSFLKHFPNLTALLILLMKSLLTILLFLSTLQVSSSPLSLGQASN